MACSNDVFVSYRRAANEGHDKWVDAFCTELRSSLIELIGPVTIWRDASHLGAGEWRPQLQEAIDGASIFLALISRTYFEAPECVKELDRFFGRMKSAPDAHKIVPVFKQPPSPQPPLPPEIRAAQRHEFFRWAPPGSPRWSELRPNGGDAQDQAFWESLGRLAQDIMFALEEIRQARRTDTLGKVFLARVCPELEQQRERLRSDLQQRGYDVVPRHEYLWNGSGFADQIGADLQGALLSVHLVSPLTSIEPDGAQRCRRQLEAAHQALKAGHGPAPLVWIAPGELQDEQAAALIRDIQGDLANDGVEYWHGSLEDLKTQIYDALPTPAPTAPAGSTAYTPPSEVALLVDEAALGEVAGLRALLTDGLGVEAKPVKFDGPAPVDPDRLRRVLERCDRAIVFWSEQPEEWLDDLLDRPELQQHLGRERLCVCVAGPATDEKAAYRSAKATVLDGTGALPEAGLRRFLSLADA